MSFNSSSLLTSHCPYTNSSHSPISARCINHRGGFVIFTAFAIINILILLPLCILVLYVGLQRCRNRSSAPGAAAMSHTDAITYHMIIVELLGILGCCFFCCGACFGLLELTRTGLYLYSITAEGHTSFHILSCVDRYLAVVYPITYLALKQSRGVLMRNIIIGCAWLCFAIFAVISQLFYRSTSSFCFFTFLHTGHRVLLPFRSPLSDSSWARSGWNQSIKEEGTSHHHGHNGCSDVEVWGVPVCPYSIHHLSDE